jgi:hypothetical protein
MCNEKIAEGYYRCSEGLIYRLKIIELDWVELRCMAKGTAMEGSDEDFRNTAAQENFEYLGTENPDE